MRIIIINNLYPPFVIGGYEINCSHVSEELIARGHEVSVLTSRSYHVDDRRYVKRVLGMQAFNPINFEDATNSLIRYLADASNYDNVCLLIEEIRAFDPDVVFFWNLHGLGGLHLVDLVDRYQIPWAFYLGDRVYEQMINCTTRQVRSVFGFASPSRFESGLSMSVSQNLFDEIERMCKYRFLKRPLLVHGYVRSKVAPVRTRCQSDHTSFVFAGRVENHKGIDVLLEATLKLAQTERALKFSVEIFGDGKLSFYEARISELGLGEYVRICGPVSQRQLFDRYLEADCFVFPTWRREPFAFAPFEAAAHGCVAIMTENCGCAERMVHGVHCLKTARSVDGLAATMRDVMYGRWDLQAIGAAGSALVLQDLSFSDNVDIMEQGLEQIKDGCCKKRRKVDTDSLLEEYLKHQLGLQWHLGRADA